MTDKLAETQAALDHDNEVRRARIRGLWLELGTLEDQRRQRFEGYVAHMGDYPPRGWDDSHRYQVEKLQAEIERHAYDIAALKAGPGYFLQQAIDAWEARKVLDDMRNVPV